MGLIVRATLKPRMIISNDYWLNSPFSINNPSGLGVRGKWHDNNWHFCFSYDRDELAVLENGPEDSDSYIRCFNDVVVRCDAFWRVNRVMAYNPRDWHEQPNNLPIDYLPYKDEVEITLE